MRLSIVFDYVYISFEPKQMMMIMSAMEKLRIMIQLRMLRLMVMMMLMMLMMLMMMMMLMMLMMMIINSHYTTSGASEVTTYNFMCV